MDSSNGRRQDHSEIAEKRSQYHHLHPAPTLESKERVYAFWSCNTIHHIHPRLVTHSGRDTYPCSSYLIQDRYSLPNRSKRLCFQNWVKAHCPSRHDNPDRIHFQVLALLLLDSSAFPSNRHRRSFCPSYQQQSVVFQYYLT